jgi:hypothetical protein
MFGVTGIPEFNYVTGNVLTTRPAAAYGTQITPGNNTYGLYTEILSDTDVTRDCYGILVNINSITVSTAATDSITTIGIDTSGGTSYVDFIPHLLSSAASTYTTQSGGHWYYFPVFIPAGSALAAKGSINRATVGTQRVAVWLYGAPSDPSSLKVGQGVEAIGITAASSAGTAVTSGGAAEGTWTSLGSTTKQCFSWNFGIGVNDAGMNSGIYHADLSYGDGTNQKVIGLDKWYMSSNAEILSSVIFPAQYCHVPVGGTIYGRLQFSGTASAALSMAAYGVY